VVLLRVLRRRCMMIHHLLLAFLASHLASMQRQSSTHDGWKRMQTRERKCVSVKVH
jgi:hypothetical protein